jgi:L-asparaginase
VTYSEVTDSNKVPLVYRISCIKDNVLYIKPYVGINYDRYSLDGVSAVLHGLYHSSTANALMETKQSALRMLDRCKNAGIPMYIFPCNKEAYRYVTTKALLEGGAIPINGGTWNRAYTELLIRYAEYIRHE